MFNRNKIPKYKELKKYEKGLMILSLIFTIAAIILVFLFRLKVIKYDIWYFSFSITCLLLSIIYFKYDRITAMVSFLMMFLLLGMGLKVFGL